MRMIKAEDLEHLSAEEASLKLAFALEVGEPLVGIRSPSISAEHWRQIDRDGFIPVMWYADSAHPFEIGAIRLDGPDVKVPEWCRTLRIDGRLCAGNGVEFTLKILRRNAAKSIKVVATAKTLNELTLKIE